MKPRKFLALLMGASMLAPLPSGALAPPDYRQEAIANVDSHAKMAQVMVDTVFSFGEPGFQEIETSNYLTGVLEKNGFKVTRGIAGIPTGWVATWGSGKPVISLGSDIDDIPQASQKPGVGYRDVLVNGAPGHGEGHNAGVPMNITAAIAVKKIMERDHIPGTIQLWPGIAEEQMAAKAYFVRAGNSTPRPSARPRRARCVPATARPRHARSIRGS